MHSAMRRGLLALALLAGAAPAVAEPFPAKPITLVVPQGPGSGSDVTARLVANYLGPVLGQTVVVDNRAGGSGIVAHQAVARAAPDGYTLLFTSTAQLLVVPLINPAAKYTMGDFTAVAPILRAPFAVVVANEPGAPKSFNELLQRLRAGPQSYASAGIGTMTHLGSELWMRKAGVSASHIPYKGSGQALTDLMGGQTLFATDSLTAEMTHIRSGKLRALAIADAQRKPSLPDVPTFDEAGLPGVQVAVIGGLFAPKGVPQDVAGRIASAMTKVLAMPEVQQRFAAMESEPLTMPADEFVKLLGKEAAVWAPLVRDLGVKVE
ncbi:tripartite tricarboxylate transporter substrate binding protein [Aquincola sp. MAHUQ-54]|uniref:Tripartite tricarboxylate transporter substrate binding protein n=1 Tax=Aquincola agrisoli TaxID=3119538 RepID=A0AAW9PYJ9_9BURK